MVLSLSASLACVSLSSRALPAFKRAVKSRSSRSAFPLSAFDWVYLGVKTCEVFLCFVTIMFVLSFVLTSLFSLFYVTRYTEDEPFDLQLRIICSLISSSASPNSQVFARVVSLEWKLSKISPSFC